MKKYKGIKLFGFDGELKKFEKELISGNFDLGKFLKDYQTSHKKYLETKERQKTKRRRVKMNCLICGRELEFIKRGGGWIHKETNSIYIMKCKDCGYEGGNRFTCPNCGSKNYVDDHCVSPDYSKGGKR